MINLHKCVLFYYLGGIVNQFFNRTKIYSFFTLAFCSLLFAVLWFVRGVFIVQPNQQVLVMRFGKLERIISDPGLYWYLSGIESIVVYPKQMLAADIEKTELTLKGQQRIIVDVFARYFITDPRLFYQSVSKTNDIVYHGENSVRLHNSRSSFMEEPDLDATPAMKRALYRIKTTIASQVMNTLGEYTLSEVLSDTRKQFEENIKTEVSKQIEQMGIKIAEVRIKRISFPEENTKAIETRMCTGPQKEAQKLLGMAKQYYASHIAETNVKVNEIKAQAVQKSADMISKATQDANKMVLEVYSKCQPLAEFILNIDSIKELKGNNHEALLDPATIAKIYQSLLA